LVSIVTYVFAMDKLAQDIVNVIGDYHNDQGFHFTSAHIIEWVNQFNLTDRQFLLEEFCHLLNQGIYISKTKATELLRKSLIGMSQHFKYATVIDFLIDTKFLNLQPAPKSQGELLALLDILLIEDYNLTVEQCGTKDPKNFVYYDDLLATGGTISRITNGWLSSNHQSGPPNFTMVNKGKIRFIICVFCSHSWGLQTCRWLWKFNLKNDEIMRSVKVFHHYVLKTKLGCQASG
jgi:hypothetical protein